jgi:hypothetical protein
MTKPPCPTEAEEGEVFVAWLRVNGIKFSHIPNETGHTQEAMRRAVRMKRQGTSKGFPDYVIALPHVGMAFVELKRERGSRTSPEQLEWVDIINTTPGAQAEVCAGAAAAIAFVSRLMGKSLMVTPLPTVDDGLNF